VLCQVYTRHSFRVSGDDPNGLDNATRIVGFSPDGRQICLGTDPEGRYFVLDVTTGAALMSTPPIGNVLEEGLRWHAFMGADGACYFTRQVFETQSALFTRVVLERLTAQGLEDVAELVGPSQPDAMRSVGNFIANPHRPIALNLRDAGFPILVDLTTGALTQLDRLDSDNVFASFARNGSVVVQSAYYFGARDVRVVDLQGNVVAPTREDELPFLHRVHDLRGRIRDFGFGSPTLERIHFAPPQGRALYGMVWSQIPEALRTQIDAERVQRPGG